MNKQLELFGLAVQPGDVVRVVSTKLGRFGERTDVISVGHGTVRVASLVECEDPDVIYIDNQGIICKRIP